MQLENHANMFLTCSFCLDYGNQYSSNDPEQITGSLGASVDLPCRLAAGGGEVSWRREGGPLPPNAVQIRTVLRIDRVTDQDSGRYVCSSQAGEQYVDLRIERKFFFLAD